MSWVGYTLSIAGIVVGGLVGLVFFLLSIKNRKPVYYWKTRQVIGKGAEFSDDIAIQFKGKPVDNVSVTKVVFMNRGRESIRRYDVTKPITLGFDRDTLILAEPKTEPSRDDIEFTASRQGSEVSLAFDFLDRNDGAVIEIIHNGDKDLKPTMKGTIIGVPKGIAEEDYEKVSPRDRRGKILALVIFAGLLTLMIYNSISITISDNSGDGIDWVWTAITSIFNLGLSVVLLIQLRHLIQTLPPWANLDN